MPDRASADRDSRIRLAAFNWLEHVTRIHGEVLPWKGVLAKGFEYDGRRVPIVSQQGIFKPAVLDDMPLSLRTSAKGPYDDHFGDDDMLRYAYRGDDPQHFQNVWVRNAMRRQAPLIYCHAVVPGRYLVVWPVYVVDDQPQNLTFSVAADVAKIPEHHRGAVYDQPAEEQYRRRYATREFRQRLHQKGFRERVLQAYKEQCALCRLRHPELLEAAHIIPETDPDSQPIVPNGLSLCRLHHAAFDRMLIGIRPDYSVEVRREVLDEEDGPMLRHGLQGVHNQTIWTPRSAELRPNQSFLEHRYEMFRKAPETGGHSAG